MDGSLAEFLVETTALGNPQFTREKHWELWGSMRKGISLAWQMALDMYDWLVTHIHTHIYTYTYIHIYIYFNYIINYINWIQLGSGWDTHGYNTFF